MVKLIYAACGNCVYILQVYFQFFFITGVKILLEALH